MDVVSRMKEVRLSCQFVPVYYHALANIGHQPQSLPFTIQISISLIQDKKLLTRSS